MILRLPALLWTVVGDGRQRGSLDGSLAAWTVARSCWSLVSIDALVDVDSGRQVAWRVSRRDEIQLGSESSSNCDETALAAKVCMYPPRRKPC